MSSRSMVVLGLVAAGGLGACNSEPAASTAAPTAAGSVPAPGAAAPAPSPAVPSPAIADVQGFEGQITLAASSAKEPAPKTVTVVVKGKQLAFTVPEGAGNGPLAKKARVLVDGAALRGTVISDEERTAITFDLKRFGEQWKQIVPAEVQRPGSAGTPPRVTKTGQRDTVAGYSCDEWDVVQSDGTRGRVCVASGDASWLELPGIGFTADQAWAREIFDGKHVPLRFVELDAAGKETARLAVTALTKRTVAATELAVPPGYQTIDPAAMMGGLLGALPGLPPPGAGSAMPDFSKMQLPPAALEAMKRMQAQPQR